jgi:hypothetical protein
MSTYACVPQTAKPYTPLSTTREGSTCSSCYATNILHFAVDNQTLDHLSLIAKQNT